MRIPSTVVVALLLILGSAGTSAREPLVEPHAMLYYQVSFGGGDAADRQTTFGFRMDHVMYSADSAPDYSGLMKRPAILDLKMNHRGIESFTVSGRDYLALYRVHHADEGEDGTEKAAMEGEGAETGAAEEGEETTAAEGQEAEQPPEYPQVGKDIGDTMKTVMDKASPGIIIGVGLGIALLAGVGG